MLKPSKETAAIRRIIASLSDKDLRRSGPKDFKEAVEKIGLDYKQVRNNINNELTRRRRIRGIRKGQGRKIAPNAEERIDSDFERSRKTGLDLDKFKDQWFHSWADASQVAKGFFQFAERMGSPANLLLLMEVKGEGEKHDDDVSGKKIGGKKVVKRG